VSCRLPLSLVNVNVTRRHLHLHVISSDLTAPALKTKRHYNTFSPRVGFFVPLDEVRAWFDNDDGDVNAVPQQRQLAKVSNLIILLRVMYV
jgi:hypothetical protein